VGTREAVRAAVRDSAPVEIRERDATAPRESLSRAIEAVGATAANLAIADDGRSVMAHGRPLDVGYALGRLMVALAAEGVKAAAPTPLDDGARIRVAAATAAD
jgi:hypothetical protein